MIAMMVLHGVNLIVHVIFMLMEDLSGHRGKFLYWANWGSAVIGIPLTILSYVVSHLV